MTTWMDYLSDSLDGLPDKDRQSAKTRDNSEICRYAPPSCSPEDGNLYDQASIDVSTPTISTNDPTLTVPTAGGSCGEISDAASKSATSCDKLTADGDTREDSQAIQDGSAITRNETRTLDSLEPSANIYGDAATREGAEALYAAKSVWTHPPPSPSCNTARRPATFGDNGHPHH